MKKNLISLIAGLAILGFAGSAKAANVALGATLAATNANGAALSTLVDGTFLPERTHWQSGTVWWRGTNEIELTLTDVFTINSFTVQADNNDRYEILYKDLSDDQWKLAWTVPYLYNGGGMSTRNSGLLADSVTTNALMFKQLNGDNMYSVSEIQAFGDVPQTPAPEPASLVYGIMTIAGALGLRKRR